jgi:hypothetical protein
MKKFIYSLIILFTFIPLSTVFGQSTQTLVDWAYKYNLTKYETVKGFMFYDSITREQAAKFMSMSFMLAWLQVNHNKEYPIVDYVDCNDFKDKNLIDSSLLDFSFMICELELMMGSKGYFMPKSLLTDTEVKIIVDRAIARNPNLSTKWIDRYITDTNQPISRWRLLRILYGIVKNEEERKGPVNYITTSR